MPIQLPPLRSLDDFISGDARFQLPTFDNPERWSNRVVNNLLYYQTNYFLTILCFFVAVGLFNPSAMVLGCVIVAVVSCGIIYLFYQNSSATSTNLDHQLVRALKTHPYFSCTVTLVTLCFLMRIFDAILTFLFGIAAPLLLVLIHASLRLRNVKNKVANTKEMVGASRTPLGWLFDCGP